MSKEPKDERIPIMMEASLLERVETYRFTNRIGSRGEAIRRLVREGLEKEMPAPAGN